MSEIDLKTAVEIIHSQGVVAMPTETVYGLAAKISSAEGIRRIFLTKERPFFDPLIVHVDSIQHAKSCFTEWPDIAQTLVKFFWPGPLTLVMNKSPLISDVITSGLPRVAVRWPLHAVAQQLISAVGEPLAAPSANKFGKTSPTTIEHVQSEFGVSFPILKGDQSQIGIESTVLLINNDTDLAILRKGTITKSMITHVLEKFNLKFNWVESAEKAIAPGQMKHHYMPTIPLVIVKPHSSVNTESQILDYVNRHLRQLPDEIDGVKIVKPQRDIQHLTNLSLPDSAVEAARVLYSELRLKSVAPGAEALLFKQEAIHQGEMWESVFDRLYKAASLIID